MLLIDQHVKSMLKENIALAIRNAQYQFPHIGETTMRKRYKDWVQNGRPNTMIQHDGRKLKMNLRAITDHVEN